MEQPSLPKTNRRGLLRTTLRYTAAFGAALGGLALFKRNGGPLTETACHDLPGRLGCGQCTQLASCGLPRGLSFKQVRKELDHGR